ncbi:hypothetical protein ACHAXT_005600 [Thalassiosira profunda]
MSTSNHWDNDVRNECGACGAEGSASHKLYLCKGCHAVKYCGKACQMNDRKAHKHFCRAHHCKSTNSEERMAMMQHTMRFVCDEAWTHGFLYTYGIAETHPSKVES